MKVNVLLGIDLSAYAEVEVEVGLAEDVDALIEAVQAVPDHDLYFDVDWENYGGKRIVRVRDDLDHDRFPRISIEPVPYSGGYALQSWLKGQSKGGLAELVADAEEAMLIDPVENVTYAGALTGPRGASTEIGFVARRGACKEELLIALVKALADEGWSFDVAPAGGAA